MSKVSIETAMLGLCLGTLILFSFKDGFRRDVVIVNLLTIACISLIILSTMLSTSERPFEALNFCLGCAIGKAISALVGKTDRPVSADWFFAAVAVISCCLAVFARWSANSYTYHQIPRWDAGLKDPNLFGICMAVGSVSALLVILNAWTTRSSAFSDRFRLCICLASLCFVLNGLLHTYSRGAWLAFLLGTCILTVIYSSNCLGHCPAVMTSGARSWIWRNRCSLFAISLSTIILLAVSFGIDGGDRRLASMLDASDRSWTNRLVAWDKGLAMMVDFPRGVGWGQVETIYRHWYKPECIAGSAAIHTNDVVIVTCNAGIVAGLAFLAITTIRIKAILSAIKVSTCTVLTSETMRMDGSYRVEREVSGAVLVVVILFGSFFNSVLFFLPVAAVFWTCIFFVQRVRTCA